MPKITKMINNRKGQALSKTGILFVVIIFYAVTITFIGYINGYYNTSIVAEQVPMSDRTELSFFQMVIDGISDLPIWINFILFGSLVIIIGWIVVSSLPLWNGGS